MSMSITLLLLATITCNTYLTALYLFALPGVQPLRIHISTFTNQQVNHIAYVFPAIQRDKKRSHSLHVFIDGFLVYIRPLVELK